MGVEPVISTPPVFADFLRDEVAKWTRVIKDAGIAQN
jgi:hypothetical protein